MTEVGTRLLSWLASVGWLALKVAFLIVLMVVVGMLVAWLGWWFFLLPLLLLLLAPLFRRYRHQRSIAAFRLLHSDAGADKDLLVVYTDSPHWQPYIDQNWVPRWGDRMILFNRSRPWRPDQSEARLWRMRTGGGRQNTPAAIVLNGKHAGHVIRLRHDFRDFKHGRPARLHAAEQEIDKVLREM